jgi:hypothetical protein
VDLIAIGRDDGFDGGEADGFLLFVFEGHGDERSVVVWTFRRPTAYPTMVCPISICLDRLSRAWSEMSALRAPTR